MKKSRFEVKLVSGSSIEVWAATANQAKILAQAEYINRGLDYKVTEVLYLEALEP